MDEFERADRLTPKQQRVVDALTIGATQATAAEAGGVAVSTVRRWQQLPAVRRALAEQQAAAVGEAARAAVAKMTDALATLEGIMGDANVSASVRLAAARALLEAAVKLHDAAMVNERIAALEAQVLVKV